MSVWIRVERKAYYAILERMQRSDLDITEWILRFLACLGQAIGGAERVLCGQICVLTPN